MSNKTEDLIERFLYVGYKGYKYTMRNTAEGRRLERHLPTVIYGQEFSCYREYVAYEMADYLKRNLPNANIELFLDGNDSTIKMEINDKEEELINKKMEEFLNLCEKLEEK